MKIIIEPTADQSYKPHPFATVSVELANDHLILGDVIEKLIRPALIAWGFLESQVSEQLNIQQ